MSQEEIKEIENDLNEQLSRMHDFLTEEETFSEFFRITCDVAECIRDTLEDYEEELFKPKESIKRFTFFEIIDMVDKFYKKYAINIDLHDLIDKGIIDTNSESYEAGTPIEEIKGDGFMYFSCNSGRKEIMIRRTGTLRDALVLVHELSHYRDIAKFQNSKYEYSLNIEYLTESLADTEALIFINSLDATLNFDKKETIRERLRFYHKIAQNTVAILALINIYRDYHYLSEELLKNVYDNDQYLLILKLFKDKNISELLSFLRYSLCPVISVKGLELQKENESFITKAQELHELILESPLANVLTYYSLPVDRGELLNTVEVNLRSLCENVLNEEKISKNKN